MRIVCVSDTHTYGRMITVPDGDVLIHSGDHTFEGTQSEIEYELEWLESLPHKHKVFIGGNHDFFLDNAYDADKLGDIELRKRLLDLKRLKLHVFGHIHESYGTFATTDKHGDMLFVNAASNNIDYRPVNKPIVIEKVGDNYEVQADAGAGK